MQLTSTNGSFQRILRQLSQRKLVTICVVILVIYLVVALLGAFDLLPDYQERVGQEYEPPSLTLAKLLGTDLFGRSVLYKILAGTKTAMLIGFLVTAISVPIGITLGALAGFYGGIVDAAVVWLYTVISAVPSILIIIALSYIFGTGLVAMCLALGLVGWVQLCRLMRGEFLKHRDREYVLAAKSFGASDLRVIVFHILPNTIHLAIITGSLQVLGAIKYEVILTFLGVGLQDGSWGTMIDAARDEMVQGIWWPLAGVVLAMFLIIYALNVVSDALRDILDPKLS